MLGFNVSSVDLKYGTIGAVDDAGGCDSVDEL